MRARNASIRAGSGRGANGRPLRSSSLATAQTMLCPLCWSIPSTVGRLFEQGQATLIDYSSNLVEVGARLKQERERQGMSQTDFGQIGGVKRGSQLEYESGKRPFDIQYLLSLIRTGVDPHFILTGRRASDGLNEDQSSIVSAFDALPPANQRALLQLACSLADIPVPAPPISLPSAAALEDALNGFLQASPGLSGDELVHELARSLPTILRAAADEIDEVPLDRSDTGLSRRVIENVDHRAAQPGRRS